MRYELASLCVWDGAAVVAPGSSSTSGTRAAYASPTSASVLVSEGYEGGAADRSAGSVPIGSLGA